ncbi:hypothetical protein LUZ62_016589 [Rhynchospora pubera]|uniref:Uncharacterized protein n=1 Tax=Rhynchospora pubera TaxID=906938 RepID=A0AAV8GLW2_9POAL|nr:hypothetical protein LUZ62_016589 [Rhynchospora pubera]
MVLALGPGRFYGSSLPRPRFYPDPKLNSTRVDPPESVIDPLLSWANEAHWSMGGLSFRRLRLQGKIEGSITKLRKSMSPNPKRRKTSTRFAKERLSRLDEVDEEESESESDEEVYDSNLEEEEEEGDGESDVESEEEEEVEVVSKKRKRVRRLGDEFDRIAEEAKKVEKKENKKGKRKEKEVEKPRRVSPRKK